MFLKVIEAYRDVVALCDENLIGKKFNEDKFQLDVKESFFKEDEISEEKAIEVLKDMQKEDATFNIVGKESTTTAIKAGVISERDIQKIEGIPFAIILA